MKKILCRYRGILKIVFVLVVCAVVAVMVSMCEIEECKTCTNTQTNDSRKLCGDDLKEAQRLHYMTCK